MAEKGMSCLESQKPEIVECLEKYAPNYFFRLPPPDEEDKTRLHELIAFDATSCGRAEAVRRCVEGRLLECDDPTPSNVINSMVLAARDATPCKKFQFRTSSASKATHYSVFFMAVIAGFIKAL